jgi:3-methyladenine DNA glycosylase AlkD
MKVNEVLDQLRSCYHEKVFEMNTRNGIGKNQIGIMMGDIRKIANKIKSDHALALELWKTKIMEARLVAILIIKPKQLSLKELETMLKSVEYAPVSDWFNSYVLKEHPEKYLLREQWMYDDNAWAARAGWSLTAGKVTRDAADLDIPALLKRIEKEMAKAKPEVQWTMNTTLAQIGINHPEHRKRALEIGEKLGIYRDYPVSKGCTSPFAPTWIREMVSRKK